MWHTAITERFGLDLPLISAGMGFLALPPLAAAVSEAGGLGLLGVAPNPAPAMREMIREVRRRTARPFGVDLIVEQTAFGPCTTEEHIEVCVEESVPVVVFFWHLPPASWLARLRDRGCDVWVQVGTVEAAEEAAHLGASAVVIQGAEAGGHNRSTTGLFALLPRAVDRLAPLPVVAAGGIADGRGLVAALALGASAVLVGTRLVASCEANAHPEYKRRIVVSEAADVARTRLFGPEWPDQPMRVLRNRVVREWEGRGPGAAPPVEEGPIGRTVLFGQDYALPKFSALPPTPETSGDFEEMCLAAGESVGLVRAVQPAAEIVAELAREARAAIAALERSSGAAPAAGPAAAPGRPAAPERALDRPRRRAPR